MAYIVVGDDIETRSNIVVRGSVLLPEMKIAGIIPIIFQAAGALRLQLTIQGITLIAIGQKEVSNA